MLKDASWVKVQPFRIPEPKNRYSALWSKIKADSFRLDQLYAIHRGLWTGALYVYVVPEDVVRQNELELDGLRRAIRGRDIKPFGYIWRGFYIIYASKKHDPDFASKFPNIMKWLNAHRLILERRSTVFTWKKEWWELEDPLDPAVFECPKIISPLFARQQSFAFDLNNYYLSDTATIIRPWLNQEELSLYAENWKRVNQPDLNLEEFISRHKEFFNAFTNINEALIYTLGLLNSEVLEFFFKLYSPRLMKRTKRPKKGRWYSYMPPYLNLLPIKLGENQARENIIKETQILIDLTKKYLKLQLSNEAQDDTLLEHIESEIGLHTHQLNEIVYDIYGIGENERIIIQNYVFKKR